MTRKERIEFEIMLIKAQRALMTKLKTDTVQYDEHQLIIIQQQELRRNLDIIALERQLLTIETITKTEE